MKSLMLTSSLAAFAAAFILLSPTAADAQTRSAISAQCSKQADAKGLHGKARRQFRATCKRGYRAKTTNP
jgi:hypothetical protein